MKGIRIFGYRLTAIAKADLFNPRATEEYILSQKWSTRYKNHLLGAYDKFCKVNGIEWNRGKRLKEEEYPIKVPTEERINMIISASTKTYALVFRISKYGLRPDEISKIILRDLDLDSGLLTVRTSKMGAGRTIRLKADVVDSLKEHIVRRKIKAIDTKLFARSSRLKSMWRHFRTKAYENNNDPELLKIRLYDLRHWYATSLYIQCRDIFHVKEMLGHRNLDNTLKYIHLANSLINYSEEYTCKVASNQAEAIKLIEAGFEYITEMDGVKLFRKRR